MSRDEYDEIKNWLDFLGVEYYTINQDCTVDVSFSVNLSDKGLTEIPVVFRFVKGSFTCSNNDLTSLKNSPVEVENFDCSHNNLTSLEYCPSKVMDFDCSYNNLTNLEYSPNVLRSYNCNNNKITSLKGCQKNVDSVFNCSFNKLTDLKDCPDVKSSFYCENNLLTSLEGCPEVIDGEFDCGNNSLTSLEYFPKKINGSYISFKHNKIDIKELFNFTCDMESARFILSDFTKDKESFVELINSIKERKILKELNQNEKNKFKNKKL